MNGFSAWLEQLQYERLLDLVVTVAAALLCITIHVTCHGWAAYRLGDPTAKQAGRLTLNPLRHIDLLGLVCMAVAHFGWAKPVPINPGNFRHFRRDTAITALAGPLSNLVLAVVAFTLYCAGVWLNWYLGQPEWLYYILLFLNYTGGMSAALAVFNLFPIPPLDGSKVLYSLLPERQYQWLLRYERFGFLVLAVLLITGVLDGPMRFLLDKLLTVLLQICRWPMALLNAPVYGR